MSTSFYDLTLPALGTGTIRFSDFKNRAVLVVNTASKCGFTPQYEGLQHLWSQYSKSGLIVVGIPSNDFGAQEPGSNDEIKEMCARNYGVSFPMAQKATVKGPHAIPLFKWLAARGGFASVPRWNFYKYLISGEGDLFTWFTPLTKPESPRVRQAIQRVLLSH